MLVKEVMQRNIVSVPSTATIQQAAMVMERRNVGSALIEEGGAYTGIVTERDLLRKVVARGIPYDRPVKSIMSSPLITIDAEETLLEAGEKMSRLNIRRLVVTEKGGIAGILGARTLVRNMRYLAASRLVMAEHYTGESAF